MNHISLSFILFFFLFGLSSVEHIVNISFSIKSGFLFLLNLGGCLRFLFPLSLGGCLHKSNHFFNDSYDCFVITSSMIFASNIYTRYHH